MVQMLNYIVKKKILLTLPTVFQNRFGRIPIIVA